MTDPRKDTILGRMGKAEKLAVHNIRARVIIESTCLVVDLSFPGKLPPQNEIEQLARKKALNTLDDQQEKMLAVTIIADEELNHRKIAALVFEVTEDNVTPEMLSRAKTMTFAVRHGGTDG